MKLPKTSRYVDKVYILPNIFTSGNMFFGFFSIISTLNGSFRKAGFSILLAMVFDLLDGRVARLTKSSSPFGVEYDSLADLVSFGVAPAILIFIWSGLNSTLPPLQKFGWLAAFFFVACGALRLARFNVQTQRKHFVGLPIPVAASLIASGILLYNVLDQEWATEWLAFGVLIAVGLLMVSNIPYKSYKDLELKQRHPLPILVTVVLFIVFMAIQPEAVLFLLALAYVFIGAIWGNIDNRRFRNKKVSSTNLISIKEKINRGI